MNQIFPPNQSHSRQADQERGLGAQVCVECSGKASTSLPALAFLWEMKELFKEWFPDAFFQPVSTGYYV